MKKIFLTGGSGFFGSRFKKTYNKQYEIISPSREALDITDKNKVLEILKIYKPDYIIHAAAIASTDFCNNNPELAYKINVEGTENIAKGAKNIGAKLIFLSSEQVFNGNKESGPYLESVTPIPNTVYGKNKLEGEKLVKKILNEVWIIRFTWMFGIPEEKCRIVTNIFWDTFKSLLKGEQIKASPEEYRGLTYIYEVIDSFPKIFEIPYGIYHMGSENFLSKYETVKFILEKLGRKDISNILIKDNKYNNNPRDIRLDCSKIKSFNIKFTRTDKIIEKLIKNLNL